MCAGACGYVYRCMWVCIKVHVGTFAGACECMLRPEDNFRCHPQKCHPPPFETGSIHWSVSTSQVRLAGQKAQGPSCPHLSSAGTVGPATTLGFYVYPEYLAQILKFSRQIPTGLSLQPRGKKGSIFLSSVLDTKVSN